MQEMGAIYTGSNRNSKSGETAQADYNSQKGNNVLFEQPKSKFHEDWPI